MNPTRPYTGSEYLESLRDDREIWIYGERVKDVTTHPAFRNTARMTARLYDALHDPATKEILTCETDTGSGGYTHRYFSPPQDAAELMAACDAIAQWQRLTYGWLGRTPDYKAAFLANLQVNADFYDPYQANAQRIFKEAQEKVLYMNHALVNPPVDRDKPVEEVRDVFVHVTKETDAGIIVNGAKVVATNSALTHYNFVAYHGLPIQAKEFAVVFALPMNTPGVKLICRPSYEMMSAVMGSPFDYPLSSRLDENDAIFVLDNVLVPWENVLIYGDVKRFNVFGRHSGFFQRLCLHGCTRLAVKLDFISGLLLKAVETTGVKDFRGVQVNVGEVLNWRNLFWSLSDAMCTRVEPWHGGTVLPNMEAALSYRMVMTTAYPRIKEIIQNLIASGLIYQPSSNLDWQNDDLRPYLDKYVRGSGGIEAVERIKLMKLLWDAIGTEFGSRHELYELNYAGNHETVRQEALLVAKGNKSADEMKAFADQCMAEYDLDGWTVPDLVSPGDVNFFETETRSAF
ncbi:MAG: 4-hydroxyphenylacetate 3-hydroxylase N-terminal domain-containing protein [Chloroflexota bacterium]